jgi:diguanylate cyclase (GGDEF)-like protein/PAS domain S-box-containing protein
MLQDSTERQIVQKAALNCGLEPVEVIEPDASLLFRPAGSGERGRGYQDAPRNDHHWLPLIVADEQSSLAGWKTVVSSKSVWSSAVVLVRDQKTPKKNAAQSISGASLPDPEALYAWVLERPLRLESVIVQIRQAVRANRVFLGRYHEVIEDLYRSRTVFDAVTNGIALADATMPDMPLVYVNPGFERMTGYTASEVYGRNCRFLQGIDTDQAGVEQIREAVLAGRPAEVLLRNYRKDGTLFWNELHLAPIVGLEGQITHYVGVQNDVTDRIDAARKLETLAHYDPLTGLANRSLLREQLKQAIARVRRTGQVVAVLVFDLANFKQANDAFGHDAADELLNTIARRLRETARGHETVARLDAVRGIGGDEFVVVLEALPDNRQHLAIARRFLEKLAEPFDFQGQPFHPKVALGCALYPRDGDDAEPLINAAEADLAAVKRAELPAEPEMPIAAAPRSKPDGKRPARGSARSSAAPAPPSPDRA